MKILITGGAGYIGSVLAPMLLQEGHYVRVLDSLMYGGHGLLPCFAHKKFEFIKGDVRNEAVYNAAIKDVDVIINLAAIVGYPACKKDPRLAQEVNVGGAQTLVNLRKKDQLILHASTGSNYGAVIGDLCTEESPLSPLTIYGRTKTEAETIIREAGNSITYRFATAFGVSNRMRLDLLINDFVHQAVNMKNLIVYEGTFRRTFLNVYDLARSFLFALSNHKALIDEVFNVGDESMNASKEDVARKIREKVDFYLHFADIGEDEDKRNYEVSYEKIRKAGYRTTISLEEGIDELIHAMSVVEIRNKFGNV
ncbi:MAG: NAD(P)-dependent oxidoreductase [Lentisphaerae bacterium]|nr:NAD(P)-dependent oxidoreductase [Lentisphaerota bacterium]